MADDGVNPFERGQLRREATDWFVRMRSDEADRLRPEFEDWLARGAVNRAFYNRVANLYGAGKNVRWEDLPPPQPVKGAIKWTLLATVAALLMLSLVAWRIIIGPLIVPGEETRSPPGKPVVASQPMLASSLGEIRRITLPDGSHLILDTDTLITTDFSPGIRELRLQRGRARFEVAHDRRPFIVDARGGQIVAHGTIFDVSLDDDLVHVSLLRGAVDVAVATGRGAGHAQVRLQPGQGVEFADGEGSLPPPLPIIRSVENWPSGIIEFDDTPLPQVVAAANRYSATKIRLADASLDRLDISGTFRVDDSPKLAGIVAQLFNLKVENEPGTIVLEPAEK